MAPRTLAELFATPKHRTLEREAWEQTLEGQAWKASADAYHARVCAATTKRRRDVAILLASALAAIRGRD